MLNDEYWHWLPFSFELQAKVVAKGREHRRVCRTRIRCGHASFVSRQIGQAEFRIDLEQAIDLRPVEHLAIEQEIGKEARQHRHADAIALCHAVDDPEGPASSLRVRTGRWRGLWRRRRDVERRTG